MTLPTSLRLLAAVSVLLSWAGAASALDPSPEDRARLNAGEVLVDIEEVEDSSLPEVQATAVIDAPPARVWAIIDACGDYAGTLPRIVESEEIARENGKVRCRLVLGAPWPVGNMTSVTVARHVAGPDRWSRTWTLESGDYERNEGSWTLVSFDDAGRRTLVAYRVLSDPKSRLPDALKKRAIRRGMPDLIESLRQEVRD